MDVTGYSSTAIGSVLETVGRITFLRAHEVERAFGFVLRTDSDEPTRREMFDLLRPAFITDRPVRLNYVKTGPRTGEIIRVANP